MIGSSCLPPHSSSHPALCCPDSLGGPPQCNRTSCSALRWTSVPSSFSSAGLSSTDNPACTRQTHTPTVTKTIQSMSGSKTQTFGCRRASYLFEDITHYLPVYFLYSHADYALINSSGHLPRVHHLQKNPNSNAALLHWVLGEEVV